MANEQNLRSLSTKEAREIGSKGGKASVQSRKRKKTMKEAMNLLLSKDVSDGNKQVLKQLGLEENDMNNQMLAVVSLFQSAVNGNVAAMRLIADITGSYAMSEADKQKIKLEKERIKIEKEKIKEPQKDGSIQESMNAIDGIVAQMEDLEDDEQ